MLKVLVHQVRSDLRYQRYALAAWFLLLLVTSLMSLPSVSLLARQRGHDAVGFSAAMVLGTVAQYALGMFLAVRWIHRDAAAASTAFWMTRPISRAAICGAKLADILVGLLLPTLLVQLGVLLASGLEAQRLGHAIAEIAFRELLVLLPVSAAAALTRDITRVVLLGAASLLGPLIIQAGLRQSGSVFDSEFTAARTAGVLVALGTGLAWATIVFIYQYLTRRTLRAITWFAAGGGVMLGLAFAWHLPLFSRSTPPLDTSVKPEEVSVAVDITRSVDALGYAQPKREGALIASSIRVSGLPIGFMERHVGTRSRLVFSDGSEAESRSFRPWVFDPAGMTSSWLSAVRQASALEWKVSEQDRVLRRRAPWIFFMRPVFSGPVDAVERWRSEGARYEAEFLFNVEKLTVQRPLPLRRGATGVVDGRRVTIADVRIRDTRIEVIVVVSEPRFIRERGRYQTTTRWTAEELFCVLAHRGRGQAIPVGVAERGWANHLAPIFWPVYVAQTTRRLLFDLGTVEEGTTPEVAEDWMKNGELLLISQEPAGQFTKKVSLPMSKLGE